MATPKANWAEGEYFTPAAANTVGQAILDLQSDVTALNNRNTFTELTSTATAGGITTMTIESKPIQEFTGTLTQTVKLPSTSVAAGAEYKIVNNSTGLVTIQTSTAAAVLALSSGSESSFIALVDTPTTAANWQFINPVDVSLAQTLTSKTLTTPTLTTPVINGVATGTGLATAGTASTLAMRDASGNVTGNALVSTVATGTAPLTVASTTVVANLNASQLQGFVSNTGAVASTLALRDASANLTAENFINVVDTTATAAGTTILTVASGGTQVFTGSTTQTVRMPTTGVVAGMQWTIINQSTGAVAVQSSTGAAIFSLPAGNAAEVTSLFDPPTTALHWRGTIWAQTAGLVATTSNSLSAFAASTTNAIGVGTVELGHASDTTLSRSAAGTLAVEGVDVVTTTGTQAISGKTAVTSTGAVTGSTLVSTVATGTPPLTVTSTTAVANLNASQLQGFVGNAGSVGSTLALRDGNAHLFAKSLIPTFVSTVASATAVTLTASSASLLEFTGTSTQTVVLPSASVTAGHNYTIINNSTGALTVQSSAGAAIGAVLTTGTSAQFFALVATPTTAANWHRR
jgi:hypothetical protein